MKSLIVGNWKMNPATMREAKRLLDATREAAERAKHATIVVAPPSVFLRELRSRSRSRRVSFAAQNAHFENGGAFTGELSMQQIKDCGVSHVLLGHAERRALGETNDALRKKVAAALVQKITPILCVGEQQRTPGGEHFALVREQLRAGFGDVPQGQAGKVVVAYEPVWAIGKDSAMSPRDMHEMAIFIRKCVVEAQGQAGMTIKILYGGSIDSLNAGAMLKDGDVDGLLVGRASEDAARFDILLQAIEAVS